MNTNIEKQALVEKIIEAILDTKGEDIKIFNILISKTLWQTTLLFVVPTQTPK